MAHYYQPEIETMKELFTSGLKNIGIPFTDPQGTYFVLADIGPYLKPGQTDVAFCEEMVQKVSVACVPGTSFFQEDVRNIVRLHFAKKDETLLAALDRLSGMANILDYLNWRGDLTLAERAFNEVDNLLLSELSYLDFGIFAPAAFSESVTLKAAADGYFAAHPTTEMGVLVPSQIPELVRRMADSARFRNLRLSGYVNQIDPQTELQFSALTLGLEDGSRYIAFRGTDDTLIGWKEDFNMVILLITIFIIRIRRRKTISGQHKMAKCVCFW